MVSSLKQALTIWIYEVFIMAAWRRLSGHGADLERAPFLRVHDTATAQPSLESNAKKQRARVETNMAPAWGRRCIGATTSWPQARL